MQERPDVSIEISAKVDLLNGPVGPILIRLAIPMAFGIAAIMLFQIVDTFWVGQLGARELAAMSFTFPVTFFVMSVTMGIGIGATSAIARALGEGDKRGVRRLTTDSLALANIIVIIVAVAGLLSIKPVFRMMGATDDLLPLISDYMLPWYWGVGLLVIPMVGNSAIRATGDTKTPSLIMIIAGGVNLVLDPLLIFGVGPFPRLELKGAALATVLSWVVTFVAALWLLARRERMLSPRWPGVAAVLNSWKQVLYIGLPAAATNVLVPLSTGVLTRFVAEHGNDSVAAFGVGNRIESLAMIGIFALGTAITPFVGQNFGAGKGARVRAGLSFGVKACLLWGVAVAVLLAAAASPLARAFNDDPEVVRVARQYLYILPVSYGLLGISILVNSTFNALKRPMHSAFIIVLRLFVFAVPFAYLGTSTFGMTGLLGGMTLANLLIGCVALVMARRMALTMDSELSLETAAPVR